MRPNSVCHSWYPSLLFFFFFYNNQIENTQIAIYCIHRLALLLFSSPWSIIKIPLTPQQAHSAIGQNALFHGKTLLHFHRTLHPDTANYLETLQKMSHSILAVVHSSYLILLHWDLGLFFLCFAVVFWFVFVFYSPF